MMLLADDDLEQFGDDVVRVSPLSDLSDELIKESIAEQIENPFISKSDFLEEFKNNVEVDEMEADQDDDMLNEIKKTANDFYTRVLQMLEAKFNLGLDEDLVYGLTGSALRNFCEGIYEFFVVNYEDNLSNFLVKRIVDNKDAIVDALRNDGELVDVVTSSYRNRIHDDTYSTILANIGSSIMAIKDLDIIPEEFIEYFDSDRFDAAVLRYGIASGMIHGDFIEKFMAPIYSGTKSDIHDIITIEVQQGVFNDYKDKLPLERPKEEEEVYG